MEPPTTLQGHELPESRLYTFIDQSREFAAYFLEGQKLIHDFALTHDLQGDGFAYLRKVLLSVQPMIAFLKQGEQIGFYIDSEEPLFRLKIETAHHGATRCALFPETMREFPETMTGIVRVQKLFPRNRPPYQSILEIAAEPLREIVNRVLRDSYQTNSRVTISDASDQSLLLHQLPPISGREDYDYSEDAVRKRRNELSGTVEAMLARAVVEPEAIREGFAQMGFRLLAARPVRFECSCSRERAIQGLQSIYRHQPHDLFDPDQDVLEVTCEYCKSRHEISRRELEEAVNPLN